MKNFARFLLMSNLLLEIRKLVIFFILAGEIISCFEQFEILAMKIFARLLILSKLLLETRIFF